MKVLKYLAITAIAGFMASCTNEAMTDDAQVVNDVMTTRTVVEPVSIPEITKLMSAIEVDETIMNEVKNGVERSLKYGLGEHLRFNDILKPNESKVLRTLNSSHTLAEELRKTYYDLKKANTMSLSEEDFFTALSNSNFIIRWPYVENWNGTTKPLICFVEENGYTVYKPQQGKDGKFTIDSTKVTEDFIKNNPIWVISESSLSYEEIPDFENGEFYNDEGTFFYSPYAVEKLNLKSPKIDRKGLYIATMMFNDHYDGMMAGPGEFDFLWQSVPGGVASSKKIMHCSSSGIIGIVQQVNLLIRSEWPAAERTNGIVILEKDGGKNKTGKQILSYGELSARNIEVPFSYEKKDEFILNYIWGWGTLFDDQNIEENGDLKRFYGLRNDFWISFRYFE